MWITLAILATAALALSAVLSLHKWESRRFVRRGLTNRVQRDEAIQAVLIVPCKGIDIGQVENLRALFEQRQIDYQLRLVVEDERDSAAELIAALQAEFPHVRSELLIAGRAIESGQKVHNLLIATENLPADVNVLAFADSDARPGPDWLAALVSRLNELQIGARTGYRWMVPERMTWPNLLVYSINCSVASMYSRHRLNAVWGGAWAIRRELFEQVGIREAWAGTLSDDLVVTRVLRASGLQIEFEPRCLTASPVDMTAREAVNFLRRQFLLVRRYAPLHWWLALAGSSLLQGGLWGAAVLTLGSAIAGQAWWLPGLMGLTLYVLAMFRGWLGQSAFRARLAGHESKLASPRRFDILLGPLAGVCGWLTMLSSLVGSSMTWRGIRYWISPGGRVLLLGRVVEAGSLSGAIRMPGRSSGDKALEIQRRALERGIRLHDAATEVPRDRKAA
ncbi:MAG TPA: glycosyltransferase [Pirellulaceae bacterium]|nr:glycosyltransferase [Pirellulaceae bacterium]